MNKQHDNFFRSVFYKPERIIALLRLAAKNNVNLATFLSTVDLSTLTDISENYTDINDNGSADLAYTVRLKNGQSAKLLVGIIVEHKSYVINNKLSCSLPS